MVAGLLVTLAMATSAHAGGSVWEFEGYHRPGDVVVSTTAVAWEHDASLGTPEDGPYLIYMAPAHVTIEAWPRIPEESILVAVVEVHEGPFAAADGDLYGPHHAVARFEIPDVPPGIYQILHCNDPCTSTLGDLIGGWDLRVIAGDAGRPPEEVAAEARDRMATAPLVIAAESPPTTRPGHFEAPAPEAETARQPASFDALWMLVVAVIALLLVVRMARIESGWRLQPGEERVRIVGEVLIDE